MLRSACLRHPVSGSRWGAWDVISGGVAPGYVISALSGRISAHHGEGLCLDSVQDLEFVTRDVLLEGEHPRLEERMERLDQRLVRVAEAYLTELAEELMRLEVWGKHCYRADLLDQLPEVTGNGLMRRRE